MMHAQTCIVIPRPLYPVDVLHNHIKFYRKFKAEAICLGAHLKWFESRLYDQLVRMNDRRLAFNLWAAARQFPCRAAIKSELDKLKDTKVSEAVLEIIETTCRNAESEHLILRSHSPMIHGAPLIADYQRLKAKVICIGGKLKLLESCIREGLMNLPDLDSAMSLWERAKRLPSDAAIHCELNQISDRNTARGARAVLKAALQSMARG